MWAQLQKVSSSPERETELLDIFEQLNALEQPDSGLVKTMVMRSQANPSDVFVLVLFESEEKARARERDPRRQDRIKGIRASMGEVLDGPPEFFDLTVIQDA